MTATRPMPNLGTQQSPIDLTDAFDANIRVSIHWRGLKLTPNTNDGYSPPRKHAASATNKGGHIKVDGEKYIPVDLHWHFPCEHHLKGKDFPCEVHVVHVHEDDVPWALQGKLDWCRIAVLGVYLRAGRAAYPPIDAASSAKPVKVSRKDILPADSPAVRYDGSLTTPPYSENVTFVIFEKPLTATKDQLRDGGRPNARALQDRNRRCCVRGKVR